MAGNHMYMMENCLEQVEKASDWKQLEFKIVMWMCLGVFCTEHMCKIMDGRTNGNVTESCLEQVEKENVWKPFKFV